MKFRFLGGMDCPDWLLGQIAEFSKLTSLKFKGLSQVAIDYLLTDQLNQESLTKFVTESIDADKIQSFVITLAFYIIDKAAGYQCLVGDLEAELTQLGLPPEHSKMLSKLYASNFPALTKRAMDHIPKEANFEIISLKRLNDGQVLMEYKSKNETKKLTMSTEQFVSFKKDMIAIGKKVNEKF